MQIFDSDLGVVVISCTTILVAPIQGTLESILYYNIYLNSTVVLTTLRQTDGHGETMKVPCNFRTLKTLYYARKLVYDFQHNFHYNSYFYSRKNEPVPSQNTNMDKQEQKIQGNTGIVAWAEMRRTTNLSAHYGQTPCSCVIVSLYILALLGIWN